MLLDYDKFRPVKIGGFFFLLIATSCLVCLVAVLEKPGFRELLILVTAWHLITGLGVIFFAFSSQARIIAHPPQELGHICNNRFGQQSKGDFITSSTLIPNLK